MIVDATGAEKGIRRFTRDAIGAGPRSICGILEQLEIPSEIFLAEDVLFKGFLGGYSTLFISAMTMDIVAVKKIITKWRNNNDGKVILGGPISSDLENVMSNLKLDIMVIGEGEETVKELVKNNLLSNLKERKLLQKVKGIIYFDDTNKIRNTGFRQYTTPEQFKKYSPSTKSIINYPNFSFAKVYVECVRGCSNFGATTLLLPNGKHCNNCGLCGGENLIDRQNCPQGIPPGCGFCSVPNLFGPARSRPIEKISQEIKELLVLGVKRIVLSAPDFLDFARDETIYPKLLMNPRFPLANDIKIEELLKHITSLDVVKQKKAWIEVENIKAHLFTEKVAQIISRYLPNSSFSIGCETGSEKHALELGRTSALAEVFQALKIAHRYELKIHIYFIHSLPGQTEQTAKETVEFIHKIEPYIDKITLYRFRPLPMSAFGDFPEPKAAVFNQTSKIIAEAANEVNLRKKKELLGKKIQVVISEVNTRDPKSAIAIILEGGPKVVLENAWDRIGEFAEIQIEKVLSERLVKGKILD